MLAFNSVYKSVQKSLIDGVPAWRSENNNSAIRILSRAMMEGSDDGAIQNIFKKQHIVVPDQFVPKLAFDEKGLKTLAELNKPVTVHGECL